jgi:hypothetical protein
VLAWVWWGLPLVLEGEPDEDGHQFPFTPKQLAWLHVELTCLVAVGAVYFMGLGAWPEGVWPILPVFLVPKKAPKLWWLVINQHHLNLKLLTVWCKFELIGMLACLAGWNWWGITFDLAQGYHHVAMHPSLFPYMGFQVGPNFYPYEVLPFGLKWSLWVFTKVVWVMVCWWRSQGILVFSYINNFCVVVVTCNKLILICNWVIMPTLAQLGWVHKETKGQWELVQVVEVLGLLLDLCQGKILIPEWKILCAIASCQLQLGQWLTCWALAGVVGFLTSLMCVAPLIQLYLCLLYAILGCACSKWDEEVVVSALMVEDLSWIVAYLCQVQGAPLWRPSQVVVVMSNVALTWGWGRYIAELDLTVRGLHTAAKMVEPIHLLELWAVLWMLASFVEHLCSQQVECWTNNTVALAYLANSSGWDPIMNQLVQWIHGLLVAVGASLYLAVWICSSKNVKADQALHWVDKDNWELDSLTVVAICLQFGTWVVD